MNVDIALSILETERMMKVTGKEALMDDPQPTLTALATVVLELRREVQNLRRRIDLLQH